MPRVRRGLVIDPLLESYIDSALCSLAEPYGKDRLHPDTLDRMVLDCTTFRELVGEGYEAVAARVHPSDIGCDLWVTRNNRRKVSDEAPGFWAPEYRSLRVSTGWVGVAHRLGPYRLVLGTDDTLHGERIDWDGDVVGEAPEEAPSAPPRRRGMTFVDELAEFAPPVEPVPSQRAETIRVGTIRTEATQEIPRDSEAAPDPSTMWWLVRAAPEAQQEEVGAALQELRESAQVFIRGDAPSPATQAPLPSGVLPHDVAVAMGLAPEVADDDRVPCPHCARLGQSLACGLCGGPGWVRAGTARFYLQNNPGGDNATTR